LAGRGGQGLRPSTGTPLTALGFQANLQRNNLQAATFCGRRRLDAHGRRFRARHMLGSSHPLCSEEELDMSTLSVLSNLPALHSEGGLSRYLAAIRKFPLLSAADEAMYARRWHEHGDSEAAYRLVTSHLRLAAKLALRYRGYGLPIADLISEANLGLMHAVKRFKPEKGARLAT
jgi:RNA polymerase sigma-32 factor